MKFRIVRTTSSIFRVEFKRSWFSALWTVDSRHYNSDNALAQVKYLKELVNKGIKL